MRKTVILISMAFIALVGCRQEKKKQPFLMMPEWDPFRKYVADSLKHLLIVLDSVYYSDQKYRQLDNSLKYNKEQRKIDSVNLTIVKPIVDKYGILGREDIGLIGNTAIVMTIQHADLATQEKYLPLFREALKKKKILPSNYAMLEDRVAVRNGRMQMFGTQVMIKKKKAELFPVMDIDSVNARRFSIGMTESLGTYVRRFGIKWDVEEYKRELPGLIKKYKISERDTISLHLKEKL